MANITFRQFGLQMRKASTRYGRNVDEMGREAATAFITTAVNLTPVLTAKAASNWTLNPVTPLFLNGPPIAEGDGQASKEATIARALAVLPLWRWSRQSLWAANGVPYILALDQGSSIKAPAGMTAAAEVAARLRITERRVERGLQRIFDGR